MIKLSQQKPEKNNTIYNSQCRITYVLISSRFPTFFLHSRKWHVRPIEKYPSFCTTGRRAFSYIHAYNFRSGFAIEMDDNEGVRHSLANCRPRNGRSRETGLGKSKALLPPHWWEVVSFMLKQHILRGSAASKIGERWRRIS